MSKLPASIFSVVFLISAQPAVAQGPAEVVEDAMRDTTLKKVEDPDGWTATANVGLSGSLNDARNVVGSEQGTTAQVGGVVSGAAKWKKEVHRLELNGDFQVSQTKTPSIDPWIKSTDLLDLRGVYYYSLASHPWFGGFGRLRFNTQVFRGNVVRADAYTVTEKRFVEQADGTEAEVTSINSLAAQTRKNLTRPFDPIQLRQTIGIFADPINEKPLIFKSKLGFGSQQILARNPLFVAAEDKATRTLTLQEIPSVLDLGAELDLDLSGIIVDDVLTWKAQAAFFLPVVTSKLDGPEDVASDEGTLDKLNSEFKVGLSAKISKYISLDYVFQARKIPSISPEWQIMNGLLLSAGFQLL